VVGCNDSQANEHKPIGSSTRLSVFEWPSGLARLACARTCAVEAVIATTAASAMFKLGTLVQSIAEELRWDQNCSSATTSPRLTLKLIANLIYLVIGSNTSGLYSPALADFIVSTGRSIITRAIDRSKELGVVVVAGHIESVYFSNSSGAASIVHSVFGVCFKVCEKLNPKP